MLDEARRVSRQPGVEGRCQATSGIPSQATGRLRGLRKEVGNRVDDGDLVDLALALVPLQLLHSSLGQRIQQRRDAHQVGLAYPCLHLDQPGLDAAAAPCPHPFATEPPPSCPSLSMSDPIGRWCRM